MKNAIPVITTTATSATTIAPDPLKPEPLLEPVLDTGIVGVIVVVLGTVAGETGTPGENGLVVSGTAGVLEAAAAPSDAPPDDPPAPKAVAGPKAGNAGTTPTASRVTTASRATTAPRDLSRRLIRNPNAPPDQLAL